MAATIAAADPLVHLSYKCYYTPYSTPALCNIIFIDSVAFLQLEMDTNVCSSVTDSFDC